ncbi:hypothetical protein ACO1O0_001052 [Amphichorda felina]
MGATIGVVGFLGQLFDGCVKAYGYFSTAQHLDGDSQKLLCKVRIEEMRLVVWGREWGVAEGKLEAHLDSSSERGNPQLRALATQILEQLHGTVTDFRKLKESYGLTDAVEAVGAEPGGGKGVKGKPSGKEAQGRKTTNEAKVERSWKREFGLKAKWVIQDKDKFTDLLGDLKGSQPPTSLHVTRTKIYAEINSLDFNDGLERLFPPWQLPSFQRAWTHQLLESAQRDVTQLSLLENASTGVYPQLNNSANLKKLRINLDAQPQSAFKPTRALKVPRPALSIVDAHPDSSGARTPTGGSSTDFHRCHAHHESAGDVLVEWVEYDREALDERVAHLRRMDDLARMMHSASERHPDLHSIDCLGYTDDAECSRYGLVYRAPAPSFSSLHTLIANPDLKTPDLDQRVRLAAKLAVAAWSLHSLDWLHKSLCASNVLFFPSAFASSAHGATAHGALVPDISRPYLSGFDASRPDLDTALSVVPRNPSIAGLHRHPGSVRGLPYTKAFDIYSLGLVLLEIGLWKVLQTYHKPHYSAERWRDKVVLPVLVPGLGSKVGRRYREVVEMCLGVEEGLSSSEAGKLMESVVGKLESIRL